MDLVSSCARGATSIVLALLTAGAVSAGPVERPQPGPATLEAGGFAPRFQLGDGVRSPLVLDVERVTGTGELAPLPPRVLPKSLGDRLILTLDDGMALPVTSSYEARLDVSGGIAGATDAVAVRVPARSLAVAPPFRVSNVLLGLDDVHGATTWPSVELWLEDAGAPLQPRRGALSAAAPFNAIAAGLTPSGASRPTDFQRLPVNLTLDVPATWLTDGSWDDAFARPDGPLDDGGEWIECLGGVCGASSTAQVAGQAVVRSTGGSILSLVKFQKVSVGAVRLARDLDLRASVRLTDTAPGFRRAGLLLRVMAADTFYRVEYLDTPASVVVEAVVGGVSTPLAALPVLAAPTGSRLLTVTLVSALDGVTDINVAVDGISIGSVQDTNFHFTGSLVGLSASDPAGTGERWDDFIVERRPDIFAVVQYPAGEDAGMPLDVSDDSLISDAVLVSTDGVNFTPRAPRPGCANPGNPFVQLEVEDTVGTRLFEHEARIISVAIECPTCPTGPPACSENSAPASSAKPTPTAGELHSVRLGWWNEHLDTASVLIRGAVHEGPCSFKGVLLASEAPPAVAVPGQLGGTPALQALAFLDFTPLQQGAHCIVIEEHHDSNGDCCPDGFEQLGAQDGCPGPCVATSWTDSNPSTNVVERDFTVGLACTPKQEDIGRDGPDDLDGDTIPDEINLDGDSLRVVRGSGDDIVVTWALNDSLVFPATYNVHLVRGPFTGGCFIQVAPVFDRPVGVLARTYTLPVTPGLPASFAIFETDGCTSGASVPDSSSDDPSLRCP